MPFNEAELAKGQLRKLNALRKSIGDDLAEEVFGKWLLRQASVKSKEQQDPIAAKIAEALERDVISRNRLWIPTNRVL